MSVNKLFNEAKDRMGWTVV